MRIGPLLHNYDLWLTRLVIEHAPGWIYYEQPWVGRKTAQATALMLMSLAGMTHVVGFRQKVTVYPALNVTVVKHFTGTGGGKRVERKARVFAEACARGLAPETEDEADAQAILSYAAHVLGGPAKLARAARA
jgi:Holliday junction resolvasome RuvABC endonuclease subunit